MSNLKSFGRYLLLIAIVLFSSLFASGQTKVLIKAPEVVEVGEQFRANYIIESDKEVKESIVIKNMSGFEILYGPAQSTSISTSFQQGKRVSTYTATSSYILKALKPGKYTLPRADVMVDGKKYKADSFTIEVKKSGVEEIQKSLSDIDAFIKVIPSKTRVGSTDTLTLTYRLYTTNDIHRIIRTDLPDIRGFYTTNITHPRQLFQEEKLNGKVYKVVDLRQLLLQPQRDGTITIPEGSVTVLYSLPTGKQVRDMWGDVYEEKLTEEKVLTIESVTISVMDLKAI